MHECGAGLPTCETLATRATEKTYNDRALTPTPFFKQLSPTRIGFRDGIGILSWLGTPFFGFGVIVLLMVLFQSQKGPDFWGWLLMGLVLFVGGGVTVFRRDWWICDSAERCIIQSCEVLVPVHRKITPLSDFDSVLLQSVWAQYRHQRDRVEYYVYLHAVRGADCNMLVASSRHLDSARQVAETLAHHANLSLLDRSDEDPRRW